MEPLLELSDRITATLWEFTRDRPDGSGSLTIASTKVRDNIQQQAEMDYARLQQLLDLWDPDGPTGDSNAEPLDWVLNKEYSFLGRTREAAYAALSAARRVAWNRLPASLRDKWKAEEAPVSAREDETSDRKRAAKIVVGELADRIDLLEDIWRNTREDFCGNGLVSLLAYSTAKADARSLINSDELFDRIKRWISSRFVSIKDRVRLAECFLQSPTRMRKEREYPLFLMEESLNKRVEQILKYGPTVFSPDTGSQPMRKWAERWNGRELSKKLPILLNRRALRLLCKVLDVPVPFSLAFSDELDEILISRDFRLGDLTANPSPGELSDNQKQALRKVADLLPEYHPAAPSLFGVALSGGGIRSATFALGVFQAMADRNILPSIDLLSSVSGGGYFASFLTAWIKRRGGVRSVQHSLQGFASNTPCTPPPRSELDMFDINRPPERLPLNQNPMADHLRPIRLLRDYGRYLAPEEGLFSADTWTVFSTWFRNTSLNFVILMLFLSGLLLLPRVAVFLIYMMRGAFTSATNGRAFLAAFFSGLPFALISCWIGRRNLRTFDRYRISAQKTFRGQGDGSVVLWAAVGPLLVGFLETAVIWNTESFKYPSHAAGGFTLACLVSLLVMAAASIHSAQIFDINVTRRFWWRLFGRIILFLISCAAAGALMAGFCAFLGRFAVNSLSGTWIAAAVGPALMTIVVSVTIVLMLGLAGRTLSEEEREWWARLGAWLTILTLAWLGISCICFFAPLGILYAGIRISVAGITWAGITAAGVKLAYNPKFKSAQTGQSPPWWQNWILKIAPAVFVVGVLCGLAFLLFLVTGPLLIHLGPSLSPYSRSVNAAQTNLLGSTDGWFSLTHLRENYWPLLNSGSVIAVALPGILFLISALMAWRVDVNLFSMHHFYRNRLVRAYLGSSRTRAHREPNAFTGFDMQDDLYLHRLVVSDRSQKEDLVTDCRASYYGPFPILNTALNVTKGQDLGLQQRRAESFIFTPIWSGFDYMRRQSLVRESAKMEFGFRCTRGFGGDGAFVGTAMAISGAAFSSNAGYHTSPPLAFLLTVFGVRLGWWAGNPRKRFWDCQTPPDSLSYLKDELTANTTTDRNFVLLTDGGHFENMGLYELIRRRCRYIIVVDAEQDEKFKLEGIGGAIRKCRDDFGVVIDLNLDPLKPIGDPKKSRMHHTVGTVRYPGEDKDGRLIYIKASLTGDESVDLVEFSQSHPEFPHTPTTNQMFDESHFESYRQLGHHIGSKVFQRNWKVRGRDVVADRFDDLQNDWESQKRELESKLQGGNGRQPAGDDPAREGAQ